MASSVDGRIIPSRWRPEGPRGDLYERLHEQLDSQAWLVGRVTGQEFARGAPYSTAAQGSFPREPWYAVQDGAAFAVIIDAHGKIAWGRSDIGGDPIVVVLTEAVADAHLAGLRSDGVSYIFAGKDELDLAGALEVLNSDLGIERVLLEGGGVINGAFLRAGLVDEISLIIWPVIDGATGAPSVFDSLPADAGHAPPTSAMRLVACERMNDDAVWLRYEITSG